MNRFTLSLSALMLFFSAIGVAQSAISQENLESFKMNPELSISTNAGISENHSTLMAAIKVADLEDILSSDGPFTVFAPSNVAFDKLSEFDISNFLKPDNKKEVYSLLTHHIVAGNISASNILRQMCQGKGTASFTTVLGDELIATMDGTDIVLTDEFGNTAKIIKADATQCNGVIHEIDSVFVPKKI
ncbi:fasciclin domain-containing protein [uncultured Maribacter sp.]|uniref:fasciclin domain-containing protein n=1 Tax=uncultured Maribacter sp. TaxID=431308 RepID=UPI002626E0B2|nr:fasciclin domain-containing protein [uncultured Maribacter sp.]